MPRAASIGLILMAFFCAACSKETDYSPSPPVKFGMTATPNGNSGEGTFEIKQKQIYWIELDLHYKTQDQLRELLSLVGSTTDRYRGIQSAKDVNIPIYVTIYDHMGYIILDADVRVNGYTNHRSEDIDSGYVGRNIVSVMLAPGEYKIKVAALRPPGIFSDFGWSVGVFNYIH